MPVGCLGLLETSAVWETPPLPRTGWGGGFVLTGGLRRVLICDTSLDFSRPAEQRRLSRSFNTVVNQKQANDAM